MLEESRGVLEPCMTVNRQPCRSSSQKKQSGPFEIIRTASSLLRAFRVNNALKRLCNGTLPALLRSNASRLPRSDWETLSIDEVRLFFLLLANFPITFIRRCHDPRGKNSVSLTFLHHIKLPINELRSISDKGLEKD